MKDAAERLYKLKSNKSPGSDGLFKVFWNCIDVFVRSINYAYDHNMLSITQRHGIST